MTSYSNAATWTWTGMSVPANEGERPKSVDRSKDLFFTKAVELKDGWTGQLIIGGEIVKESPGHEKAEDALEEMNEFILKRLKKLLVG